MMNKLNVIFLLTLALLLANKTQAQNKEVSAYIITAAGDTVQGEMKKQPSKNAISFKAAGSTTFRTYNTEDVQAFVLEGNMRYMAVPVMVQNEQQRVFMQVVVDGPVKLYYNQGLRTEADFYVQKPDKPVLQLHRQYYMGTLSSLFSECQPAARVKYNFSSLAAFISGYNACKYGYTTETPYKSTRSVTTTFGVKAGAGLTSLKLDRDATKDEEGNFDTQTNFTAGLFMNFRMTGKAFSVQPEL
ncbi:MAG: hypothetical protein LPK03_15990, partial [Pontibacter sp.]|nr:hypothetical protein [Pontibacter sp.]